MKKKIQRHERGRKQELQHACADIEEGDESEPPNHFKIKNFVLNIHCKIKIRPRHPPPSRNAYNTSSNCFKIKSLRSDLIPDMRY